MVAEKTAKTLGVHFFCHIL